MEVLTDTSTVVATMDDSAIELHCEMRGFIRPDSSLIWEGPDGQRITDGTGKHQITFSDGVPDAAANGSAVLIPSQVSTLNITNPEPSDAGTYTCTVNGTAEAIVINVWVNGSESIDGNMTLADINTTTYGIQAYSTTHPKTTGHAQQLTGIVAGCVTATLTLTEVLLIAAVIMYYLISRRGQSKNNINNATQSSPNPVYYYDYINLELDRSIHHNDQPGVNTAKDDDCMTNVNTTERQNSNHATVMNVEPGTTIDSGIDVAHGVVVDGLSTALEVNMAYGVVDTVMEENEAYGVAIDGVGIDSIERNVAYGAVMSNAEYGNDTAREPIHNIMVDSTNV